MFRVHYPLAWTFHRGTNIRSLDPSVAVAFPDGFTPYKEYPGAVVFGLPRPKLPEVTLESAIRRRRSCREFRAEPLDLEQLATALHSGYGFEAPELRPLFGSAARSIPSAGGLYPIELYAVCFSVNGLPEGVYHYHPLEHALELVRADGVPPSLLPALFSNQPFVVGAAVFLVIAGVPERSLWKYGERGYRYVLFEAGHIAQTINLAAAALGLGSLNLGKFLDADLSSVLDIKDETEIPLYVIALGLPSRPIDDEDNGAPASGPLA